jgi:deoxycytidylate deaminase
VVLLASTSAPAEAPSQTESGAAPAVRTQAAGPRRIAVFDLEATGADPVLAQASSLLLPTEVRSRNPGAQVIASSEVQSLLGLERQKEMLGCGTSACMAEIAGALGVGELVSGRLGMVGKTYVLELRRIDVKAARVLGSAVRTLHGEEDALIQAIRETVAELYGVAGADLPARPGSPLVAVAVQPERPGRTFSWVLTAGGGAVLVVSGLGLAVTAKTASDYQSQQSGTPGTATVTRDQAESAKRLNRVSWAGLIVGGAATTWGIARLLRSSSGTAVSAAPIPGGAAVAMEGRF